MTGAHQPPVNRWLDALAQRELAIPGRYQLTAIPPAPVREPWWLPLWRWFDDRWQRLWSMVWGHVHVSPGAARGIGDALLAAIALFLLYVAIRLIRDMTFARPAPAGSPEPLDAPPDPTALYREACEAANRGDYGNAALLLFAATIALLDLRGAVSADPSATVGDLRRELRAARANLVPAFDAVATPFVEQAYAERGIAAPQWQHARSAFDQVIMNLPKRE